MQARDIDELRHEPPSGRPSWRTRLAQILWFVASMGDAVTAGRAKTLIVERETGRVVGEVVQRFGNEFYDVPLKKDLVALDVAGFEAKWLAR